MYFEGKSDAELVAMSDAEVNQRIDLTCAERGIPLWCEELPEPKPEVEPDWELYQVCGVNFSDGAVAREIAKSIERERRWKQAYNYRYGFDRLEMEQDESEIGVTLVRCFRPETFHKHKAEITKHEEQKKVYEARKKENRKAYDERSDVATRVWSEINDARRRINESDRLRNLYVRYVGLANGDKEMARKFLIAAEKFNDDWQPNEGWVA